MNRLDLSFLIDLERFGNSAENIAQFDVIRHAEYFDFAPLIACIRSGDELTPRLRELIALILEGKIKRPRGRLEKMETTLRDFEISAFVEECEMRGVLKADAIFEASQHFDVSDVKVRSALKACSVLDAAYQADLEGRES